MKPQLFNLSAIVSLQLNFTSLLQANFQGTRQAIFRCHREHAINSVHFKRTELLT